VPAWLQCTCLGVCGGRFQGDMVLISAGHPLDDELVVEGVVLERARR